MIGETLKKQYFGSGVLKYKRICLKCGKLDDQISRYEAWREKRTKKAQDRIARAQTLMDQKEK
jgi:hypothetical protein